ncbi:inositol monophosphatase 1-like [Styela clava]
MDSEDFQLAEEYFAFAIELAKKVGPMIRDAFYSEKEILTKSCTTDLVTETDQNVEKTILEAIKNSYPKHDFIGEESVAGGLKCNLTDAPTWIVDPIDGTTNFVHRFPYVAVCIGFVWKKERLFGVVYNPILNEMFTAFKGKGANLNDKKLKVSKEQDLGKSMIMTECGSSRDPKHLDKIFKNMQSVISAPVHAIHSLGSAACNICMVAQGGAEAYYEFGIHCWDYCAAGIIVEEAGGVVIDTQGGELDLMRRRIIAANNMSVAKSLSNVIVEQMELPRD